jgi:hypothetical protein
VTASFEALLEEECRVFTRYLLGSVPHDYVLGKYVEAHKVTTAFVSKTRFDSFLMRTAVRHPLLVKLADSYSRIAAPRSVLRKKLVLLLAILETSSLSSRMIDTEVVSGKATLVLRLVGRGAASVASLALGSLVFLPAQLFLREHTEKP